MNAVERADGQIRVAALQGGRHVIDADAANRQRRRIELRAHGVFLLAGYQNLRDAADRRKPLRQRSVCILVYLREREGRRADHQIDDWLIGGIYFLERRLARHSGRQLPRRSRDRRLHVLRGGIDVAAEIELQCDLSVAERAGRTDGVESGNSRELSFQRRRYGRSHRLRTAARKFRGDLNGWVIDVREIADRQSSIADEAEQDNASHDEGGRDRALNKEFGHRSCARPSSAWLLPPDVRKGFAFP